MRKIFLTWGLLAVAAWVRGDEGFVRTVPAQEFGAAGLQKLSPAELAKLEALVQRYKAGGVAEAASPAPLAMVVSPAESEEKVLAAEAKVREAQEKARLAEAKVREAEAKISAAETKAQEAEARSQAAESKSAAAVLKASAARPDTAKQKPSWFAALVTLTHAAEKPEKTEPLESQLVGDFSGWSGRTVFTLEDGTRWIQQNKTDIYQYTPAIRAAHVRITPSSFGSFWLEVMGVNNRVRVLPLSLPGQK